MTWEVKCVWGGVREEGGEGRESKVGAGLHLHVLGKCIGLAGNGREAGPWTSGAGPSPPPFAHHPHIPT